MKKILYLCFSFLLIFLLVGCKGDKKNVDVIDASINDDNELILELSDGTKINVGVVVGEEGPPGADGSAGVGIKEITLHSDGNLSITLTDGTEIDLGKVVGNDGADGADGKDGIGIKNIEINEKGELLITYSNDETENLGKVVGNDGATGEAGKDGKDGKDGVAGADGADGLSAYELYLKYYPHYPGNEKEWLNELVMGTLTLKVGFELFEGTFPKDYEIPEVLMKGEYFLPANPEKGGYVFDGWFLDAELEKEYNPELGIQNDIILYAKWFSGGEFVSTGEVELIAVDDEIYLFEEFELLVDGERLSLTEDNILSIKCNGVDFEPNAAETLWFNVLLPPGEYVFSIIDVNENNYGAILTIPEPETFDAIKGDILAYNRERQETYQLYTVALDVDTDARIFQQMPDGTLTELTVLESENEFQIWFRVGFLTKPQQEGIHTFLIYQDLSWKKVEINFEQENIAIYGFNSLNNLDIYTEGYYEYDPFRLREIFITDWNQLFETEWDSLDPDSFHKSAREGVAGPKDLSGSKIYQFFNDEVYGPKWNWLLDYIVTVDGIVHPSRQIVAIKGDGTNADYALYDANHLCYSLANFFNREYIVGGYTAIDFRSESKYTTVPQYNDVITVDLQYYQLVYVGEEIVLPQAPEKVDYLFDYYLLDGEKYQVGDSIAIDKDYHLTTVYKAIEYQVSFYDDENEIEALKTVYTHEEEYKLPEYVKEGYVFIGWYDNPELQGTRITTIPANTRGDKVFYAYYVVDDFVEVEATYKLNGGKLASSDLYVLKDATYVEATRYSTNGDNQGTRITVGTSRGGLYWYVIGLKKTDVEGVYEVVGKGVGFTSAEATLYISYHDGCTSEYKDIIADIYKDIDVGYLVVIEWLPPSIIADTAIDIYFIDTTDSEADITIAMSAPQQMFTPVRKGYTFLGWCQEPECTDEPITFYPGFSPEDEVQNIIYYAKWAPDEE